MHGRAIARRVDDDFWLIGSVEFIGVASSGSELYEAFARMRGRFETTLFEVARKTSDFETFCAQSCRILRRLDRSEDRRWFAVAIWHLFPTSIG